MEEKIEKIIYSTINKINDDLGVDIKTDDNSDLVGGQSPLDSLGVITFLMELENNLEENLNIELTLVNDDVLSNENTPLKNIKSLKKHLENIITLS